jgi:hypothetical protein
MPAIGDLDGAWCAVRCTFDVSWSTIAGDDLDTRMRLKPRRELRGRRIRQQIDPAPLLQVD